MTHAIFIAAFLSLTMTVTAQPLSYPPVRCDPALDDYNGVKVADPYRWLEQLDSPETRSWVEAEAKLSDSYLEKIPARENLKKRLTELLDFEKYGIPTHHGSRYFYTHNTGLQPQSVLYATDGLSGAPVVVLDPNLISTNGALALAGFTVSHGGSILAYGISQGGSDWVDWHFRDIPTGKDLPDVLRWTKYYAPVFTSDDKGVFYSAFPAPAPGQELRVRDLGHAVFYHAFGESASADRMIYSRPDHPDWQFRPQTSHDGQWLVLTVGEGEVGDKGLENVYVYNLAISDSRGDPSMRIEGFDAAYVFIEADHGLLYFQTSLNAARGRVIAIDPAVPNRASWKEIVPQTADAMNVSGSVSLVDHQLIVHTLHDAHSKVVIYSLDGTIHRELSLPGFGSVGGLEGEPDDAETFYSFMNAITPPVIYRLNLETGASEVYRAPKVPFDVGAFEAEQVFYPSKDGTRIPMLLVHKKGLKRDGSNPTLLYGYGGFGISMTPHFDPSRLVWLERGGIFAVANIRGGGEYGEDWHRQAIRAHKQIVFDDFIAGAEWLIAQHYTSTPKLAIEGGSNGGLLIGACITQRPDLFGAALAYVGVMDMLRFDQFGQGAGWVGDYGSPHDPTDFKSLYAYSPVHNVHPGAHYPATMVITGDHDTRVMPAHSFKFAAALQNAQAGSAPILLRVRLATGHGAGATTAQRIAESADAYAFLLANLDMKRN